MIRFRCECGKLLQAREEQAGLPAACPVCGHVTTVPAPDVPLVYGLSARPLPEPEAPPEQPRPPALHPELPPAPPRRSPARAVLAVLFVAGMVALGLYSGWRRKADDAATARRVLEAELPGQNKVRVKSIDLRPLPPEQGGEKGDFVGTVTDQDGQVRELARVRVRPGEVQWLLRPSEGELRQWAAENIEKAWGEKVKSFALGRTPDGLRTARIRTGNGLTIELEESRVESEGGKLGLRDPSLQIVRDSMPRYWELTIRKKRPDLAEVKVQEDGEGSWTGAARDRAGKRYAVTVRRSDLMGEAGGDAKEQFRWWLDDIQDE